MKRNIMRRLLVLLLTIVGGWGLAQAENVLSLSTASGHPGDEVTVSVALANTDAVTGLEMQLPLDEQLTYVDGSAAVTTARTDGHGIAASQRNGKLTVIVYSVSSTPLIGNEGTLFSFRLKLGKEPADYTLTPAVVLGDADGHDPGCIVRSGAITLLSPKLVLLTPSIDFGHVPICGTYNQTLQLKNSGNELLTVTDITFSEGPFTASETAFTLDAGVTKSITVTYAPTLRGKVKGTVSILSDAVNKTQKATLTADPFSVNELHVGNASGNGDEEVTVSLTMNNMEPILGAQINFTLPQQLEFVEGSFALSERCSGHTAIASTAGQKLTLIIYSAGGTAFTGNDGEIATFQLKLKGTSGTYTLHPEDVTLGNATEENMASATYNGSITINSPRVSCNATLNMGAFPVTEQAVATFSVRNTGRAPLVVNRVSFLGEGFSVTDELPLTIAQNATQALHVAYAPTEPGTATATMNIYTNDPVDRLKSIAVSCTRFEKNYVGITGGYLDNEGLTYGLNVSLENYSELVGLQMDIHWPTDVSTSTEQLTKTSRLQGFNHMLYPIEEDTWRVVIYSLDKDKVINGHTGDIFSIAFTADEREAFHNTTITVDQILLGNANEQDMTSMDIMPTLTVYKRCFINVSANDDTRGTVTAIGLDENRALWGDRLTLTATPTEGCEFAGWTDGTNILSTDAVYSFIADSDKEITAIFMYRPHRLTYMVDDEVYQEMILEYGSTVVPVDEPTKDGFTFTGWIGIPETMPDEDVCVTGWFHINAISLSNQSVTLEGGQNIVLKAYVGNSEVEFDKITWYSSDTNIASVTADGKVTGIGRGSATITCAATDGSELSLSCLVTVTSDLTLHMPFEFNFHALDYDVVNHRIPNNPSAELADYNLQLRENIPTYDEEGYLTLTSRCEGYIDKWLCGSTESGAYFYRSGQDDMTIIVKVAPKLHTGKASDLISNRDSGYNYMLRVGDHNTFYLHTSEGYTGSTTLPLTTEEPQVLVVRVNGEEGNIYLENVTTGETAIQENLHWGLSNNALRFFTSLYSSEYFQGDFYWAYYSFDYLSDEEVRKVISFNESYGQTPPAPVLVGDVNEDGNIDVDDLNLVIAKMLGKNVPEELTARMDLSGDGTIDIDDLNMIIVLILTE